MNVWIPGLIVVAVGLAAGLWFALRGTQESPETRPPADPTPPAPGRAPESPIAPVRNARRSGLVGFLVGVGSCLVVGSLVYWATEGSRPRVESSPDAAPSPMAQPSRSAAAGDPDAAHDESAELSPEAAAELAKLRSQVQAAPQDLDARRQLTVALLNANQLMEAFEQATELQRLSPNDPDAVFVEGVVRLAMGQWPLVVELMDRVLTLRPDHVLASLTKGQAESALGRTPDAIATWKKGLAAAGGKFPPLEELLAEAESGAMAPPSVAASGGGDPAAPAEGRPDDATGEGGSYRIHIELSPGTAAPAGATLFLAFRGDSPGPPAAVKRIPNPSFPIELTLGAGDSMMGQPLPTQGTLTVRLDSDGNASTTVPGDLAASAPGFSGTPVTVILEAGAKGGR